MPREPEYRNYLASDHWRKLRTRVRRRARGWCERCKVGKRSDIHHLTYERLGAEKLEDLVAVCSYCHEFLHGKRTKDPAAAVYSEQEAEFIRTYELFRTMMILDTMLSLETLPGRLAAWEKRVASLGERVGV